MAYTLIYSGGTITVTDGTINTTSTSLSLPGRNYAGYGGPVDQNMVSMLENFASSTSGPNAPIKGQMWYDATNTLLKYNISGTLTPNWVTIAGLGNDVYFGNVTLSGNLTAVDITLSGTITANNFVANYNYIHGVETGLAGAGATQGTATQLSKDFNVVSTVASGTGVKLPVSSGGHKITVFNTGANTLRVYPSTGSQINNGGVNGAYQLASGGKLEFLSVSAIQWYTLNATYS